MAKLTSIGPNLPSRAANKGSIHVHTSDCADITRNRNYDRCLRAGEVDTAHYATVKELVLSWYSPDEFDYDESDWQDYLGEFWLAPCVKVANDENGTLTN